MKKKSIFARIVTLMMMVFTLSICFSMSTVSAAAAEPVQAVAVVETANVPAVPAFVTLDVATMKASAMNNAISHTIMPMAASSGAASGGTATTGTSTETTYQTVINFFVTWIRRIGMMVAFVGAIMFGLAIKNNDAEQKQNGLMTLIAGFVVAAVCAGVDMFDLFT